MTESDALSDLPTIGASASRVRAGARLGPNDLFQFEAPAGAGGMGVVWKARDGMVGYQGR
ncbi:MAG: hypothetical protein H8E31_15580 [Planctomycetes bacterium]|nr:hypothetical protein [Planctomycetota bacterium]